MELIQSSSPIVLAGVAISALLVLLILARILRVVFHSEGGKAKALSRWARNVDFTDEQLSAMRSLWQWYRTGRKPGSNPVSVLSATAVADLMKKCELTYLPKRFRAPDEESQRARLMKELAKIGMGEIEAHIVTGMKFGKLGAANDLTEVR